MDALLYINAAFVGLLSSVHCLGMCGGIAGALMFGVDAEQRKNPMRMAGFAAAYNLGRVLTYTAAGALVGWLGQGLFDFAPASEAHIYLLMAATVFMIALGMYIGGWLPGLARIERVGVPLWKKLEPLSRRMLPIRSAPHALGFGLIWGLLPCGLVYTLLIWSVSLHDPLKSALFMASFGLGTLPSVMSAGIVSGALARVARNPRLRAAAGLIIIAMALTGLYLAWQQTRHSEHHIHQELNPGVE